MMRQPTKARMDWGDLIHPAVPANTGMVALTGPIGGAVGHIDRLIGRRGDVPQRYVPSAGAAYPYEIVLTTPDGRESALMDLARRQLVVRADTEFPLDADDYLCLVIGRPWLSMRKYGTRGYLYHLLDVGHAVFNLALLDRVASTARDCPVTVPPGIVGSVLAAGLVAAFEPHDGEADGWRLVNTTNAEIQAGRSEFEAMADRMRPPAPRRPVFFDAVPPIPGNLARFIPARRSASSFAPGPDYDLDAVLTEAFDCADAALRGLELPWPVVHVSGRVRGASALPPGDLMEGLAAQDHLLEAQAYVVFSAPVADDGAVIDDARHALLLAAGVVGEVLYLVAARHGVGITAVGGINPEFWNQVLPPGHQALYLAALGGAAEGAKVDALYQGAHG